MSGHMSSQMSSPRRPGRLAQTGFTLVEAIVAMVIIGILGGMVAVFIRVPVQGYVDSVARAELSDVADGALRRISRDLRLALPNSIRVSNDGKSLEMLLTKSGGRYLAAEDGDLLNPHLSFLDPAKKSFTVIGQMPAGKQKIVVGDAIVVYNLGPDFPQADAYSGTNRALYDEGNSSGNLVALISNPFAAQATPMQSPGARFHVVSGPVTYYCNGAAGGAGTLLRQWDYPISAVQNSPASGNPESALLANRVESCRFDYSSAASRRSALVVLTIGLHVPGSNDPTLTLLHQVHVNNTP